MPKKEIRVGAGKQPVLMEFPIYRRHALGAYTIYARIDEDLRAISITLAKGGQIYGIEFEDAYVFDRSPLAYHLGLGNYGSSAKEFRMIVDKLKKAIADI